MEKQQRTISITSTKSSPEIAVANLDPLLQSINDVNDDITYFDRKSSIFYHPVNIIDENDEENIDSNQKFHICTKCFCYIKRFSGILYSLIAALLFTCSNFIIKQLDVVLLDVFLIRFLIQGLISYVYITYKDYHVFPSNINNLLMFSRSFMAAVGSVCFYLGLELLPLPELSTLRYTQVIWTALLVLIIFRERITLPIIIASILTLIGVICVAQPTILFTKSNPINETLQISLKNDNQRLKGVFVAIFCAFSISMGIVLNKKLLEQKVRQSVIMFHFILTTTFMLIITQTYYWVFSKTNQRKFNIKEIYLTENFIYATILATLQLIPMVLTQKSIKREHPSIVTVVQASEILFSLILQNIFLAKKSNGLAIIGSILVLTSIFILGGHKLWLDRQNRTHQPIKIQRK
ncbi:unnamed protein product [Adineta steineri]|uniref:EamA domain-containing protein n=2 Tax=Adineta steineri TaxID=433720 RepID=A0A815L8A7_9BILA|nr:unnamed protein product [Adineta steineri]CAF1614714.1 unnamed protein product [Adineta steineri]